MFRNSIVSENSYFQGHDFYMKKLIENIKQYYQRASSVLTMNQRNLEYIYADNKREHYPIADDKMLTKKYLMDANVSCPDVYFVYRYFYDLRNLEEDLKRYDEFVIKPAKGSGGGGIVVIVRRDDKYWYSAGGKPYDLEDLRRHICDIIFGIYSFGLNDEAIIERRIVQHDAINEITQQGLADVRLILHNSNPILAMMRLPTGASDGRANLHQGAIGVGIDIESGVTQHATLKGESIQVHPDSGVRLLQRKIPYWEEVISSGISISKVTPLKYLGVDVAIAVEGPMVLEINVRPGIEIQNVNATGMRKILQQRSMNITPER